MSADDRELLEDSAEDLFEEAPCAYLATRPDGTIVRVNRTFARWVGHEAAALLGRRFPELLTAGGQIYHETHVAPLLQMQGQVTEIAVDVLRADGSWLPAILNARLVRDAAGRARVVRVTLFDATDRRRYEQELLRARQRDHEIAQRLQRSLLSGEPPADAAFDLAVGYRPAEEGLEVGGDWYDAFWIEEGARVALVVGDVVGRGLDAAAAMGQLRSAVRALASSRLGPAALLGAVDAYAHRHQIGQMATLVYAELELDTRRLRYACAGHPPPVAAAPDAPAELLWDGRSLPLDTVAVRPRAEAELQLAPGAAVVLYTDGIVERRREPLSAGFDRLLRRVDARRDGDAAGLVTAVLGVADLAERPDDRCVLAVRLTG